MKTPDSNDHHEAIGQHETCVPPADVWHSVENVTLAVVIMHRGHLLSRHSQWTATAFDRAVLEAENLAKELACHPDDEPTPLEVWVVQRITRVERRLIQRLRLVGSSSDAAKYDLVRNVQPVGSKIVWSSRARPNGDLGEAG